MLRGILATTGGGATLGKTFVVGADHLVFLGRSRERFFSEIPSEVESSDDLRSRLGNRFGSCDSDSLSLLVELMSCASSSLIIGVFCFFGEISSFLRLRDLGCIAALTCLL